MTKVRYERRGAAAVVTIDRRERRNAVDLETAEGLHDGFRAFEADDEARVMILTGEGPEAFCAGADLKAIAELGPHATPEKLTSMADRPEGPMGFTRLAASKPTIAAISGWCLAGGLELALWCDLRIATDTARLGYPERRWGVPLIDGGTVRLPRIVGQGRALDMILTGRPVGADEALRIGLADRVVADGASRAAAEALAAEIAAFPQRCMRADRRSALEQWSLPESAALANEFRHGRAVIESGETQSGAARFAAGAGRHGSFGS